MRKALDVFAVALFATIVSVTAAADPFGTDVKVHGSLKVDDSPVVVGAELVAVIGTDEVARTTVTQKGWYSLVIPRWDPQKPDSKGYKSED